MAKTKRPMKQGRRKQGATKTMKAAMRERIENPLRPRKFPDKAEVLYPPPGTLVKDPSRAGKSNRTRHKTASPKRRAK